jgi:hypothetical protein
MTPIWLMGEAILPGAKVGGTFKKGTKKLFNVAEELREALMTSSYAIHTYLCRAAGLTTLVVMFVRTERM